MFKDMIDFNTSVENYFNTRKNKRYGEESINYELNWASNLIKSNLRKNNRTFKINRNYVFLTSRPKWREIFAVEFEGRLADHEICDFLKPFIEKELSPRTFNNRKGKGSTAAILQVINDVISVGLTAWIIKLDISGFFPNARLDYAEKCIHNVIDKYVEDLERKDYLKWLSTVCIRNNPKENCEFKTPLYYWDEYIEPSKSVLNKPEGIGATIGRLIWQTAMGLYVNDDIKWLNEECNVKTTCFVDDFVLVFPFEDKQRVLSLIPKLRERFKEKGISLNEKKFYCQPASHGYEFLGSHLKPNRIHLNKSTIKNAFKRIKEFNKLYNKVNYIDTFMASINSYTGLLKCRRDYNIIKQLIETIDKSWWKYFKWNEKRRCLLYKKYWSKKSRLNRKYKLKL